MDAVLYKGHCVDPALKFFCRFSPTVVFSAEYGCTVFRLHSLSLFFVEYGCTIISDYTHSFSFLKNMGVPWISKYTHKCRFLLNIDVPWPPNHTHTNCFSYCMGVMHPIFTPIQCLLRKICMYCVLFIHPFSVFCAKYVCKSPQNTPFAWSRKK